MNKEREVPDNLVERVGDLFLYCQSMAEDAAIQYSPLVDSIVEKDSRNIKLIEQTLDNLLDLAFEDSNLALFKKLCRHYYTIDPLAAAEYVLAYKDIWDEEQS